MPPESSTCVAPTTLPYPFVDTPDPDQLAAIQAPAGPVRVLAPAGSGKTRVLTNRILELLNRGAAPRTILALAFNRKAAEEMRVRLEAAHVPVGRKLQDPGVTVRTLHSLGHDIVRQAYGFAYDETKRHLAGRIIARALTEESEAAPAIQALAGLFPETDPLDQALRLLKREISLVKTNLLVAEEHRMELADQPVPFGSLFRRIERELLQARCYGSYDDMIYWGLQALLDDGPLCDELQHRFQQVLIDEFQDLNACQLRFSETLTQPQMNAFVVGDDDQMIYGWRGADVRHLLHFDQRHPGTSTFILCTNYRSTQRIVEHARRLIEHNQNRHPKDIRPAAHAAAGQLSLFVAASPGAQAREAAAWIRDRRERDQRPWNDFAVLTRRRADHYTMGLILDSLQIPHTPLDVRELFCGDDASAEPVQPVESVESVEPVGSAEPVESVEPVTTDIDGVVLATMHATKGQQFPYVVLYNLTQSEHDAETDLEEERRVHYVGVTRAQEEVLVTAPPYPRCSRFVLEMMLAPDLDQLSWDELEAVTNGLEEGVTQLSRMDKLTAGNRSHRAKIRTRPPGQSVLPSGASFVRRALSRLGNRRCNTMARILRHLGLRLSVEQVRASAETK
jgi:superfamily I DNA/RNA helicase